MTRLVRALAAGLLTLACAFSSDAFAASRWSAPLTPDGWGALRIGMGEAEAVRRFRLRLVDAIEHDCHVLEVPRRPGMRVMTLNGKVDSIVVTQATPLRTDRGIGLGAREADVVRAYGPALRIEPNHYLDPPAHYLTWRPDPQGRGAMYETDEKGRVTIIHVGGETIGWTDGCA